jgi:AcrR family transcriptional regulator
MIKALLPIPAQPAVVKRRGRKRCDRARSAILSASMELLEKSPLREVTAEAIAARAGVSKATIYKWWPNKSLVALEAFLSRMQSAVATPDTGSAQKDFTAQLRSLLRFFKSPYGRIYAQFIAEGQSDSVFMAQFRDGFLKTRRDEVRVMWKRGVARGEICRRIDADVAIDLIYGPVIFRLLTGHAPLNDAQAEAIVAAVFRGLRK